MKQEVTVHIILITITTILTIPPIAMDHTALTVIPIDIQNTTQAPIENITEYTTEVSITPISIKLKTIIALGINTIVAIILTVTTLNVDILRAQIVITLNVGILRAQTVIKTL
jgi:hypothetical protein